MSTNSIVILETDTVCLINVDDVFIEASHLAEKIQSKRIMKEIFKGRQLLRIKLAIVHLGKLGCTRCVEVFGFDSRMMFLVIFTTSLFLWLLFSVIWILIFCYKFFNLKNSFLNWNTLFDDFQCSFQGFVKEFGFFSSISLQDLWIEKFFK